LADCIAAINLEDRFAPLHPPSRQSARLEKVEPLTRDISCFTFRTDGPAAFRPGQYALLRPAGIRGWRPYSMSNLPNEDGVWEFIVRNVAGGEVSAYLFGFNALGGAVEMDAPYGMAFYQPATAEVVCIAGGSGLASILSIARAAALDNICKRLVFFYGGRTPRDLCAQSFLKSLERSHLHIAYHGIVSDFADKESETWEGPRGLVHEYLVGALKVTSVDTQIYVAGPPPMVDAVEKVLTSKFSVASESIHFDRFY
jgi:toluene monooxygenase electron transfer component